MIRRRIPDKEKAKSLIYAAKGKIAFIDSLQVTEESTSTLVPETYECFRMLGEALLASRGLEATGTDHHTEMIKALIELNLDTSRPLNLLTDLKKLRHNVNYKGYWPSVAEANQVREIKKSLWGPILLEVERLVKLP